MEMMRENGKLSTGRAKKYAFHWILCGWDLVKYDVNESEQDAPFYESPDIKQLLLAMNFFSFFVMNVWLL